MIFMQQSTYGKITVKVMPGSFMAFENNNDNPGKNYLRIALVNDAQHNQKGLDRVSNGLKGLYETI